MLTLQAQLVFKNDTRKNCMSHNGSQGGVNGLGWAGLGETIELEGGNKIQIGALGAIGSSALGDFTKK